MVIFTGASDSCFDLKKEPSLASKYIAGLTNVIVHCKDSNIKHFIYISSCSIFDENPEDIITEATEPIPGNNRDKAILMGEKICTSYHKEVNFTISIARIGEIYGKYKNKVLEENICASICKGTIEEGRVTVCNNLTHNLIYLDDVIDAIYRITKKASGETTVYHITSQGSEEYSEVQLVELLEKLTAKKIEVDIREPQHNYTKHNYLSENIKELGFKEKYDIISGLKNIYTVMEKEKNNSDRKDKVKFSLLGKLFKVSDKSKRQLYPFVENVLFFLVLQLFVMLTRSVSFHQVIDFYLLYVIFIALVHGHLQATLATAFSVIGKIYVSVAMDGRFISFNDYNIYLWILQIFSVGVMVGYLKDNYKRKYEDFNDEKDKLKLELSNIKEINKGNVEIKSLYEKRLVNYKDSFARIYEIVSKLDVIEPERVIFKSIDVVTEILNTKDVAIYTCDDNTQFCRLMAASSVKAKKMKKSIKISANAEMYAKLMRQEIYVNNTLDPEYPVMVGGTYKNGNLQTVIMIMSLPFENNNLYEINIFGVLCKLIENTMDRAYEYLENINKSYNRKYDDVLNAEAFEKVLQLYSYGESENVTDFTLLKVEADEGSKDELFYLRLKQQMRDTDYIGVNSKDETYVLLTNSNQEEAKYVIERLKKNQIIAKLGDKYVY